MSILLSGKHILLRNLYEYREGYHGTTKFLFYSNRRKGHTDQQERRCKAELIADYDLLEVSKEIN